MEEQQIGGTAPQAEAGIDIEGQIQDGVQAFMQSQDPAIAVEVVTMIASMMGIAPAVDPFADQGAAPAGPAGPPAPGGAPAIPMGRNGMRMYRVGGKIYKSGGKTDPKTDPKKKATTELSSAKTRKRSVFTPQDLNSGKVQNRETTPALGKALKERTGKTVARSRVQALGKKGKDITKGGGKRIGNVAAYDAGKGKMELAGKFKDFEYEVPAFKQNLPHLDVPIAKPRKKEVLIPRESNTAEIRQKYGKGPKRRLKRVDYLQRKGYGRNKRTESGY